MHSGILPTISVLRAQWTDQTFRVSSLKQLLLSFEKKITKNQKMRMKFPDEPEKFLESEMELHAEIQELYAVAASPELYPILVQTGAVTSILGCLAHENTDISIAAIGLLQEMTVRVLLV
jgi:beta-catenin-like protein 1